MLKLSRIVIIEPNDPALETMHRATQVEHGEAELKDCNFFGLQLKHAFIITSKRQVPPNKANAAIANAPADLRHSLYQKQ